MGVRMVHPESGGVYDATPEQVPHLRAADWQEAEGFEGLGEVWPAEAQRFGGQDQVRIRHPETGGETVVARSAVEQWQRRGWQADEPEAAPPDDLDGLTVADLQELLRVRDLPVSGAKAELISRLRAGPTEEPAEPAEANQEE